MSSKKLMRKFWPWKKKILNLNKIFRVLKLKLKPKVHQILDTQVQIKIVTIKKIVIFLVFWAELESTVSKITVIQSVLLIFNSKRYLQMLILSLHQLILKNSITKTKMMILTLLTYKDKIVRTSEVQVMSRVNQIPILKKT